MDVIERTLYYSKTKRTSINYPIIIIVDYHHHSSKHANEENNDRLKFSTRSSMGQSIKNQLIGIRFGRRSYVRTRYFHVHKNNNYRKMNEENYLNNNMKMQKKYFNLNEFFSV